VDGIVNKNKISFKFLQNIKNFMAARRVLALWSFSIFWKI